MPKAQPIRIKPGRKARLNDIDPDDTGGFRHEKQAVESLRRDVVRLAELQEKFYADSRRALLVVLQAMDAGGKDGTIRHVMSGLNPQGCQVVSFKKPSDEERRHDFLWRIGRALPRRGEIGIFNRSHYEDVLVVRVHKLVPKSVWKERFDQINRFEKLLTETGTIIVKFFLHISKAEQKKRLQERFSNPAKQWKLSRPDLEERKLWEDYQVAFEDALTKCNTRWAPWFIVPANKKWYRNMVVARTLVKTLGSLDLRYPEPAEPLDGLKID